MRRARRRGAARDAHVDDRHQSRRDVHDRARERPVANKWIGQRIDDPAIDLAAIGRAQGAIGYGPIETSAELDRALARAIVDVASGLVAVVDVRVAGGATPASGAHAPSTAPSRKR